MESTKIGALLKESRVPGSPGNIARKITVKLYGKGVFAKQENRPGSENTMYYTRRAGQFIYSKLDFLNGAFGIIPDTLDSFETTVDLPCFDFIGDKVAPDWFLHYVSRPDFYAYQGGLGNGGRKARRISPDDFLELEIDLPPLPEQKKIAEILSGIDHLIRREDEYHDAMSSLLQSHLRSERFSNGESIAISDACFLVADCMHKTPVFEETGFPIVRTPNVRGGKLVHEGMKFISEESYREWIQKDKPEPGDILFTREAPLGEACLVPKDFPLCIGQRMMLLKANPRILSPEFLLFRLRSLATQQKLQLLSGGSTVGHANVKDIRNLEIEIPNESEQRVATSIYKSISCCIDKHATKKQKLLHLKQALATDLLSGRKRVTI